MPGPVIRAKGQQADGRDSVEMWRAAFGISKPPKGLHHQMCVRRLAPPPRSISSSNSKTSTVGNWKLFRSDGLTIRSLPFSACVYMYRPEDAATNRLFGPPGYTNVDELSEICIQATVLGGHQIWMPKTRKSDDSSTAAQVGQFTQRRRRCVFQVITSAAAADWCVNDTY